jgi:hypothetical protein
VVGLKFNVLWEITPSCPLKVDDEMASVAGTSGS